MASTDTQSTLRAGSFIGVLNVLMSLRKARRFFALRGCRAGGRGGVIEQRSRGSLVFGGAAAAPRTLLLRSALL